MDGGGGQSHPKVSLKIKEDPYTELEKKHHLQYFAFRSTMGASDTADGDISVQYCIENAGETSYASAWEDYTVFYTTQLNNPDSWRRLQNTGYNKDTGQLSWSYNHTNQRGKSVYFSYFPPYSYSRHLDLIEKCSRHETATVESLGQTLDGREIECVKVGTGDRVTWVIHRQHPGEHMAEFFAEGLLTRLLGLDSSGAVDGIVAQLLERFTFYMVPSMNPDGGVRGHLRTNAKGANLNREWASSPNYEAPTEKRSPEVFHVLRKMDETGVDAFVDVHGDEELPYNFLAQAVVPKWGPRLEALHGAFLASYTRANPDMQQPIAYEAPTEPSKEGDTFNIGSDQVAHRFDCLSVTLEMSFKDCWTNKDPERGWNPARARKLGASVLEPLLYVYPFLRAKGDFWTSLPEGDHYVRPTSKYK